MALSGIVFQRSNRVRLNAISFQDIWTTEDQLQTFVVSENIGGRTRMCRAVIRNPHSINESAYFMMQRIRVLDRSGIVLFLGRVGQIEPDFATSTVIITCADYLSDLSDVTVDADEYDGVYTGMSTKYLVDQIVYNETHREDPSFVHPGRSSIAIPTHYDYTTLDRALIGGVQVDPTPYKENISRKYANRGSFYDGAGYSTNPFKYEYRGVKTGFEAIHELAGADSQQDLMIMSLVSEGYVNPEVSSEILQTAFWRDWTASAQEGTENFIPLFAANTAQYLFIGSNSKFDGIEYTFRQRGNKIESSSYGTMYWEYWNGNTWVSFTPVDDDKFSYDASVTKQNYGRSTWEAANFYNWVKRDLGASPDLYGGTVGGNNPTFVWQEGAGNASGRDRDDATSLNASYAYKVQGDSVQGDGLTDTTIGTRHGLVDSTYRYWIRVSTNSMTTRGYLSTLKPYTRRSYADDVDGVKEYFHALRAEDPTYFEEIWKYTTPATNNGRDGAGGTWLSLNTTGGNDGSGKRLLWDSSDTSGTATLLDSINEDWHFGNDVPISGIEFHAVQGSYIQIEAIGTGATVSVTTVHEHGLSVNDRIIIDHSDSVPSIDSPTSGLLVVGVLNTRTFTITASHTQDMSGSDVVAIAGITGRVITGIPDYTGATLSWYMHRTDRVQGDPHGQGASTRNKGWDLVNTTSTNQDNNDYSSVYGFTRTHGRETLGFAYWTLDKGAEGSTPHWYTNVHFNMHFNHNGVTSITNGPGGVSGQTYQDIRTIAGTSTVSLTTKLARSTLATAITSTSATNDIVRISHFDYPDFHGFLDEDKILIDSEVMTIDDVSDNVFSCLRAQDGTTGATHLLGATVYRLKHDLNTGDRVLIDRSTTAGNLIDTGNQGTPITYIDDYTFTITPPNGAISGPGSPITGRVVTGSTSLNSEFENNTFHSTTPYDDRVSASVGAATSPSSNVDDSIGKRTVLGGSPVVSGVTRVAAASTTLSANIDNSPSTTTVPVVSFAIGLEDLDEVDSKLPPSISRDILIDSEQMRVTDVVGTNLTVLRAQNSTSIAAHSSGAAVSYYRTRFTTTNAHLLKVDDEVHITNSASVPNYDGIYTIVAVPSGTTFDITDQGVVASGIANCTAFSPPPNGKSLFWTKVHMTGTPKAKANVVAIRTAGSQAHLKYFARGKEPWVSNILYSPDGSAATRDLDYVYTYDESAATGPHLLDGGTGQSIETRLASDITSTTATAIPLSTAGNYGIANALIPALTSIEVHDTKAGTREIMRVTAKPNANTLTVVRGQDGTTAVAHESDDSIVSLYVNGKNQITRYASANTFLIRSISKARLVSGNSTISIVVGLDRDVESRYTTQSFPLQSGDRVTLSGIDATSTRGVGTDLNSTKQIFDVSAVDSEGTASFRINHDEATTKRGTSGLVTVLPVNLYTSTSPTLGSASNNDGDAVYFGSKHPFTQLRFDMKTKPVNGTGNRYTVQWEYFTSNGTSGAYDWIPLTNHGLFDGTNSFNSTGMREVHWSMPTDWRPCQPTVINPTGRLAGDKVSPANTGKGWLYPESGTMFDWRGDWGAGKTAFYVRARLLVRGGTGAGPIIKQVWCGPNHWNPVSMDVETLGLQEGESHADPNRFGLTLHQTASGSNHVEQIISHSVGDRPFEFINKVVVRGAEGAYGVVKDENSIRQYGITKEKVVHSTSITNSVQAEQLAVKLLHQLKPFSDNSALDISSATAVSSIRECHISTRYWPTSYHFSKPRPLRAGDMVNVVIYDRGIINERWMVSQIEYDALDGDVEIVLHRDLDRIAEVGPANQRAIRDLMGRTRELSRATFTTMDTTVESGIDFMPEGPSRTVARMAYEPIGTYSDVTLDGTTPKIDNDNYRWNLKLYSDYNSKNADKVQLRFDHKGARPDLVNIQQYTTDGAGLGLIARQQIAAQNTNDQLVNKSPIDNSVRYGTPDHTRYLPTARDHFYPQAGEGTLYLRQSGPKVDSGTLQPSRWVGNGLYIAHRGIWNDVNYGKEVETLAADGSTFPIQHHHEVFVGVSGVILYDTSAATKAVHDILPDLIDKPMVFLQVVETTSESNMAESAAPTTTFQKVTASVRSWQTNTLSGAAIRYRGFNISLYKAGADGETGLVTNDVADIPVMYLVVFNSSRDQRYSADHLA